MWVGLGVGISGSLLAAAYVYWVTEHQLMPTLLIAGAGVAGFIITYFFNRKPATPAIPSPSVTQNPQQDISPVLTINPQVTISVPAAAAAPAPAPEKKPEPRCNLKFLEVVYGANEQMHVFSHYAGQTLTFATAKFVNEAIRREELLTPTVKGRIIYRRPDGVAVLDISNASWVPGAGNQMYETFEVNTPKYLLLFFLGNQTRFVRMLQPALARVAGTRRRIYEPHDYEIKDVIGSADVQLLTDTELLYTVRLNFTDSDQRLLPFYGGFEEL